MDEDDKLLSAAQKWSLQSSSATSSSSSDALLGQSSNNISQNVSLHHIMSSSIPAALSTSTAPIPPTPADSDHGSSISQKSSIPSYINNPSLWAPLSISSNSNDFISDPSVLAAAMSGTSIEDAVQYEVPKFAATPSISTSSKPPPSSGDTMLKTIRSDELKEEKVQQSKKQPLAEMGTFNMQNLNYQIIVVVILKPKI